MNELEKLLQKINKKNREQLLKAMEKITSGNITGMDIKKLTLKKIFRARVGKFRILFQLNDKKQKIEIIAVKIRNEKTYK